MLRRVERLQEHGQRGAHDARADQDHVGMVSTTACRHSISPSDSPEAITGHATAPSMPARSNSPAPRFIASAYGADLVTDDRDAQDRARRHEDRSSIRLGVRPLAPLPAESGQDGHTSWGIVIRLRRGGDQAAQRAPDLRDSETNQRGARCGRPSRHGIRKNQVKHLSGRSGVGCRRFDRCELYSLAVHGAQIWPLVPRPIERYSKPAAAIAVRVVEVAAVHEGRGAISDRSPPGRAA